MPRRQDRRRGDEGGAVVDWGQRYVRIMAKVACDVVARRQMDEWPYSACNAVSSQVSYEGSVCAVSLYFNGIRKMSC
jgi:hypothetical protein